MGECSRLGPRSSCQKPSATITSRIVDSSCLLSSVCVDPFDELGTEYEAPDSDLGINVTWLEKQASFLGTELVLLELEVNFPSELFGINSIVCRNFGECVPVTQSSNPRNDPSCGTLTEVFVNTTKIC